jgi:hypothetical protein
VKSNKPRSSKQEPAIRIWSYEQTRLASPYIASIMRSLRNTVLEAQHREIAAERLAKKPGRPDRRGIVEQEVAWCEAREASDRFHEALEELHSLDIYCLDPIQGQALVPFARNDQLAWYVYDLFDSQPVRFWRYHNDPPETRRPVTETPYGQWTGYAV